MTATNSDPAHEWTDREIERIADELRRQYSEATAEMMEKQARFLKEYEFEKTKMDNALKAGDITKAQYKRYMRDLTLQREWYSEMIDSLSEGAYNADVRAADTINNSIPRVYAENYNYGTYDAEVKLKINTNFTLMDEDTVRRIVRDNPDLLPETTVNRGKDIVWNKQKFNSAVLQGLIQGESIPDLASRIGSVMGMNYRASVRNARTACTSAENAGRLESYYRMRELGINVRKEWIATLDHRTRSTHRKEDKAVKELEDRFSHTGLMYPGDMSTNDPGEVYNCRCTVIANMDGVDYDSADRFSRLKDTTYDRWKRSRK